MTNKKTFDEIKKDFKKIVEESPLPTVTLNEIDNKSDLKWKSLLLLSNKSINGPYRSLKLSYNKYNSEGVEVKRNEARKWLKHSSNLMWTIRSFSSMKWNIKMIL